VQVCRELQLLWQRNVSVMRYRIDPCGRDVRMDLLPFVALRDFHALNRGKHARTIIRADATGCEVFDGTQSVFVRCDAGRFVKGEDWWMDHVLPVETERGQDDREDLLLPGRWQIEFDRPITLHVTISLSPVEPVDFDAELARRRLALPAVSGVSDTVGRLVNSANDFVVARRKPSGEPGVTVIAGYPWFADWGRDTMICLPGLFLCTRRFEEAASVLGVFSQYISDGMIPNRFNDYSNQPEYNTVDASLWFIHACFEYRTASRDEHTFKEVLLPACRKIIAGYRAGTRYGIAMDPSDGLITQGDPSTQLTWMDAKCDGIAFTPRQGKPVEINALWYHALRLMSEFDPELIGIAEMVKGHFARSFFLTPTRGCADVVNGQFRDASIRPNQIFAVSLPHCALDEAQQKAVVDVVQRELLTPVGLRTLARSDPKFCADFTGPQMKRDAAYHNGTIWPWLIGHFLDAYLKVHDASPVAKQQARTWLQPLLDHLASDACIGSISEVFEAGTLRPAGCCAQAWSVAEVLRLSMKLGM
jgi:predicted glycogen debranching enzyme